MGNTEWTDIKFFKNKFLRHYYELDFRSAIEMAEKYYNHYKFQKENVKSIQFAMTAVYFRKTILLETFPCKIHFPIPLNLSECPKSKSSALKACSQAVSMSM